MDEWPIFLSHILNERRINVMLPLGDTRPFHLKQARAAIEAYVAEEGCVQPCYATMEREGVNAQSTLRKPANRTCSVR